MDRQQGDKLPVSVFKKHGVLDGTWENGTSAYSKRGVATMVPKWNAESCIQCNRCSMACPHAAIRPVLLSDEEKAQVPASFETVPAKGLGKDVPAYSFRMQISPYDCLGCGVCLTVCPANANDKTADALVMTPFEEMKPEQANFDEVAMNDKYLKKDVISDKNVKSMQFAKPYFQFSAACAGCAETTYIKLVSQLVGDRMYIGNAAGCSSAISGGAPILPYCKDSCGRGPAWEHSLFEDNAEFAYGFFHAQDAIRKEILIRLETLKDAGVAVNDIDDYQNNWEDKEKTRAVSDALVAALEKAREDRGRPVRPGQQGVPVQEVHLGHRRRRLGLRHRLRRHRPRHGAEPRREPAGPGYRGVLQHRRTVLQVHSHLRGGQVRRRRQAGGQEGPGRHPDELWLCVRGPGGHGRRPGPDPQGHPRG